MGFNGIYGDLYIWKSINGIKLFMDLHLYGFTGFI